MKLSILWNQKAINQFDSLVKYIEKDSFLNAERFKKQILEEIDELLINPERYQTDKFKIKNDGSFRAFEKYSCRISYRIKSNQIRIIRLRHTKMSPLYY
jgi:plasmid stabilization system protein ParE